MPSILKHRRVRVAYHALRRRTSGGSLSILARHLASPTCEVIGARHVDRIEDGEDARAVFVAGLAGPLYYPAGMDLHELYQVLTEQMESWSWHYYEVPETRVQPGDVVLDCGAAEGLFTALTAGRAAKVFCFEPLGDFVDCLRRSFAGNENVEVVASALGEREGTAYLQRSGISSTLSDVPTADTVEVTTVDAFCARNGVRPSFLKADLEGFEMQLLAGARETIRACKPRVAITTYHCPGDERAIRGLLSEIRPDYRFRCKGIEHHWGEPIMLHAW